MSMAQVKNKNGRESNQPVADQGGDACGVFPTALDVEVQGLVAWSRPLSQIIRVVAGGWLRGWLRGWV